mmetsp:Transcript_24041/g.50983  ORF Transcript_24041/g.50983 Transcript_24041/m.50983 type:complete len:119 (+) Transcript_24041:239-595(+)
MEQSNQEPKLALSLEENMTASKDPSFDPESVPDATQEINIEQATDTSSFAIRLCDSLAAVCAAITFIIGFSLHMTSLNDVVDDDSTTLEKLLFIKKMKPCTTFRIMYCTQSLDLLNWC